jgi:hypothetical protein
MLADLPVDLAAPIGSDLELLGRLVLTYNGEYLNNGTLDPLGQQSSYRKIDARIGIGSVEDKFSASLVGKNVRSEVVDNSTEAFLGVYRGFIQAPRTVWVQARYRLGSA